MSCTISVSARGAIKNVSAFGKGSFIWANNYVGNPVQPSGIAFGDDFKNHIDHGNGSILRDLVRPVTLGLRERLPKFSLEIPMRPSTKSFRICRIPCLTCDQKFLKNNTGKPSRPRAVSVFISFMMQFSSVSEMWAQDWCSPPPTNAQPPPRWTAPARNP
jgi:hypothetical protein